MEYQVAIALPTSVLAALILKSVVNGMRYARRTLDDVTAADGDFDAVRVEWQPPSGALSKFCLLYISIPVHNFVVAVMRGLRRFSTKRGA